MANKIAYFCSMYPSLSHTFIRREIYEMRARGFDIEVYATRRCAEDKLLSESDVKEYEQTKSILPFNLLRFLAVNLKLFIRNPIRYIRTFFIAINHRLPGIKNFIWSILQFFEAMLLADMLQKDKTEHLHVHFGNAGANICYFSAYYLQLSWSMTLHGTSCFDFPSGPLLEDKIAHCTFTNCISYFGLSQVFRQSNPDDWHKLFVTRCGIEPAVVDEALTGKMAKPSDDMVNLIYVGRLSAEKGVNIIVQALSEVVKEFSAIKLTIVGDGPRRAFLEGQVEKYKLNKHIDFVGAVPEREVFNQMRACDMLVMSSFMEGIPMVLMEAMALELPVIAPRLAGIPELVIDKENGLLFDPASTEQLAKQIATLAQDAKLRTKLGKNGRVKVLDEFSINKAVEKLADRFNKITVT